jgi:hypothetical protein
VLKRLLLALLFPIQLLLAANLHYSLYKLDTNKGGDTLLIIGGIHGNEPGGYFAPMLFIKHYKIESGNVWVVPNLNFDSIIASQRGIYGDMNRKFATIKKNDKDYLIVEDIKKIILDPSVKLILNLHDGHGFYRKYYQNGIFNPQAWGQACIIDQNALAGAKYGNLAEIASKVIKKNNVLLEEDVHEFNIKNTETKDKDAAMRQSLTYFAIQNKKPAMAVETSKNITDIPTKVLYQLKSIEEFMKIMGIKYKRDFDLNKTEIVKLLGQYGNIVFDSSNSILPLDDIRSKINFFPVSKSKITFSSDNPLAAAVPIKNQMSLYNGSIRLSNIQLSQMPIDNSLKQTDIIIDGKSLNVKLATIVDAKNSFKIKAPNGYRVNIIGWSKRGVINENDIEITRSTIDKNYSVDNGARSFRVEFYKDKSYCGNIIIKFEK